MEIEERFESDDNCRNRQACLLIFARDAIGAPHNSLFGHFAAWLPIAIKK